MKKTGYNIGFAKWRLTCFYDSSVQDLSAVFQMNICAENPPLPLSSSFVTYCVPTFLYQPQFGNGENYLFKPPHP